MPEPLNVRSFGDGRPVLALHGVTGHAERWKVLADAVPGVRWNAVDLRGHGYSPWTPPWSIEQHVADALAVLDALGLERVPVIGHSYGGAIALHLAWAAPHRVDRLVLLDPALGLNPDDMLEAAETTRPDETYPDRAAARADRVERWGGGVPDELVDAELDAHLYEEDGRLRYRYCRSAVVTAWSEMARPAVVPPPGIPTLIVPAKQADYVSPDWLDACRGAIGDALTVVEVDAGHMVYLERTADVAAAVGPFLAR
ncbi:alpha/beta fold hydrolase [Pseudonocardia sp. CA-107938]|uniref:alpha/beta fold hydrolase n=1 Tax=Pseudonocardia sp. CA-107938 TaxID=3240021 RepID=UPI003D90E866